jgi:hypothetical protein
MHATIAALAILAAGADPQFQQMSLGVVYAPLGAAAKEFKAPTTDGVIIMSVLQNSPAARAKLSPLDIVTHVGPTRVHSPHEAREAVAACEAGKPVTIKGFRYYESKSGAPRWSSRSYKAKPEPLGDVLMEGIRKTPDAIKGETLYEDAGSAESYHTKTEIKAYFIVSGTKIGPLRFVFTYQGPDWLFIQKYIIKTKADTFEIPASPRAEGEVLRAGRISEWYDCAPPDAEKIITSLNATGTRAIRYEGRNYKNDRDIPLEEIGRLWRVMMVRKLLAS